MNTCGVYAGSFNPFHKGHLNILEKAERIFDRVIIAAGSNPDKSNIQKMDFNYRFPTSIQNREIVEFSGLLTDFLKSLILKEECNIVLIRGARNSIDFHQEIVQYRYLQDMMPKLNMVTIYCDKEYDHVSSTTIRQLQTIDGGNIYLPKYLI